MHVEADDRRVISFKIEMSQKEWLDLPMAQKVGESFSTPLEKEEQFALVGFLKALESSYDTIAD